MTHHPNTPASRNDEADDYEKSRGALPDRLRGRADWLEARGRIKDCELMREAAIYVQEFNRMQRVAKDAGNAS